MNYKEIIIDHHYRIADKTDNVLQIRNDEDFKKVEIVILFYLHDRKIMGFLKPTDLIYDLDDVSNLYTAFRKMKEDLKFFQAQFKCDIID